MSTTVIFKIFSDSRICGKTSCYCNMILLNKQVWVFLHFS